MSFTRVTGTILGGLPVAADVHGGYDGFTGEYWSEVTAIYWLKKDGSAGKEIPRSVRDRADKYDPSFSNFMDTCECPELDKGE